MFALAACGGGDKNENLAADSALGRDLAMASDSTTAQPQLQDVPAPAPEPAPVASTPAPRPASARPTPRPTPRPRTPAPAKTPAPAPTPAAPVTGTVSAGTGMTFASNSKVCSNTQPVGEKFTASLSQTVSATNGIDIPEGATGTFEVTEARTAGNSNGTTSLGVRLVSVTFGGRTYPVESSTQSVATTRVRSASRGDDAKKVAGGAIIGAIAGQVIGKNTKGTVIGAAAGAAAGTAAAAATGNYDTCLNSGGTVSVRLDGPITVRAAATPGSGN
ncbi:MAG TPA: hypothetical protein VE869_09695 [Gemmatimonas sp.]|nr:hypothetical protein [Gemmatimonas sp.]